MATDVYGNKVMLVCCDLCNERGIDDADFIALHFHRVKICWDCARELKKELTKNDEDAPMGGHDEVYEKEYKPEPFEGWRVGQ